MAIDPIALVFYAAVCGVLAAYAPSAAGRAARAGIGAIVGLVAASVLPYLKAMMGY